MEILHINSSGRTSDSNSRKVSDYLTQRLAENANTTLVSRDLGQQPLPAISAEDLIGVHGSHSPDRDSLATQLALSEQVINELFNSDTLVIAAPMYNFGIPASLKQWIDLICRARVTFKYTDSGPVGLTGIKQAFLVIATGGTPIGGEYDFVSGYLTHICHFIGVESVHIIDVSGSKGTPEQAIEDAKKQIDKILDDQFEETEVAI